MIAEHGRRALVEAISAGDVPRVQSLLAQGADAAASDDKGRTPLHAAAKGGPEDFHEVTITVAAITEGRSISDRHAMAPFAEIAGILLSGGARADASDGEGLTPLSYACALGHTEVASVLLGHGADVNHRDVHGRTPLHLAAAKGFSAETRMLLDRGADVDPRDGDNRTPLLLAARKGYGDVVRILVDRGADLNVRDRHGSSPLPEALANRMNEIARLMIEKGARIEADEPGEDREAMCEGLIRLLRDPSAATRGYVAENLGRLRDRRAVAPLVRLLEDPEPWPREAAAEALGVLGDRLAVPALMSLTGDPHPSVRAAAATSLGLLHDPSAIDALLALLADGTDYVRGLAAEALGAFHDGRCVEALVSCLDDEAPRVRFRAARALGRWRDPRGTPRLVEFLTADTFELRRAARSVLEHLEWVPAGDAERVAWAVAGGDWEAAAAGGAAAAQPLWQVLREAEYEFGVDGEADAVDANRALGALERVLSTSASGIDTELLRELVESDVDITYPRPTISDATHTEYEPVSLGNTRRVAELAGEELARRAFPPESRPIDPEW